MWDHELATALEIGMPRRRVTYEQFELDWKEEDAMKEDKTEPNEAPESHPDVKEVSGSWKTNKPFLYQDTFGAGDPVAKQVNSS